MTEFKELTEEQKNAIAEKIAKKAIEETAEHYKNVIVPKLAEHLSRTLVENVAKEITWFGKRGQVETVTYPAKTEPEAVPAAADRNQENGENGQG